MKVTLIQTYLHWENREKNLSHFDALIDSIKEPTDLIILPEMFTTGFTMNPKQFAESDNVTLEWLKQKSKQKNAVITGSVAVKENDNNFNRLFWVEPIKLIQLMTNVIYLEWPKKTKITPQVQKK
jgi:omega-amidase